MSDPEPNPERQHRIEDLQRRLARAEAVEGLERRERRSRRLKGLGAFLVVLLAISLLAAGIRSGWFSGAGSGEGQVAPDFTLTDSEGQTFRLSDTQGTARVLFFMTTGEWCQPCKLMTRGPLREIQQKYGSNVTIASIEMIPDDQSDNDLNAYKGRYNATWTFARDTSRVAESYGVVQLSVVVILDQEGRVKFKGADPPAGTMSRVIESMGIQAQGGTA